MSDFESGSTATFPAPGAASRMVVGDFDNDGDADILYQTVGGGTAFQYARSNGDGTFTVLALGSSPFAGLTLPDNNGGTYYAGDFDGDGDTDVVAAVANTTGFYFRNDNGSFASASSATLPAPAAATRVVTGDFDGDGDEDILYQTAGDGTAFQYARSNGDGTFTILSQASSPFASLGTLPNHNGSNYLSGDFDGDGDIDLLATPNGTSGSYFSNNGNGTFSALSTATFPAPAAGGRMTAGDFDADGDLDILYQTGADGTAFQYARSNGDGTFTILSQAASPFSGLTLPNHNGGNYFAADFDGDGDTDLLTGVNGTTGSYFYQVGKPPEIASTSPADNAVGVAPTANVQITFDEAVNKGSGNIYLYRADHVLIETISVSSVQVSGAGTTWSIDPSVTLAGNTSYYVLMDAGTFADTGGAIFAGIDDSTTLNFTAALVNQPPSGTDRTVALAEDGRYAFTAGDFGFSDGDGNSLQSVRVTTTPGNGTLYYDVDGNGALSPVVVTPGTDIVVALIDVGNFWYVPGANGNGTGYDSFTFQVIDTGGTANGGSNIDATPNTFSFNVAAVNDPPVATNLAGDAASWLEGAGPALLDLGSNATIGDIDSVNFDGGSLMVHLGAGSMATEDQLVIATVGGVTSTATTVSVGGVQIATYTGGGAGGGDLVFTFDADATPAAVQALVRAIAFTNTGGDAPITGLRTVSWTFDDGDGSVNGGNPLLSLVSAIEVIGVNDAPSGANATILIDEDSRYTLSAADFGFSDVDGNSLQWVIIATLPGAGTLYYDPDGPGGIAPITFSGGTGFTVAMLNSGGLYYVPEADANGVGYASFAFQVMDNGGTANGGINTDSSLNTITFNVAAVEDLPVAVADAPTVDANVATSVAVLANDTDPDGGANGVIEINGSAVSIGVPVTLASGATVMLNADGTVGYDPNGQFDDLVSLTRALVTGATNYYATDSFSYTLNGGSSTTVTVTVMGVDEPGDQLLGSSGGNLITGTAGDDVILGFEDDDLLQGGDGNDVLYGNDNNDTLRGGAADDRLYGGNGHDSLVGGDGNDVLVGNKGNDAMAGGLGDDTYYVGEAGDTVIENLDEGTDLVRSQIDCTLSDNVENLALSAGARAGTGNGLGNTIWGSGGADALSGLAGDDTLRGREGRDALLGGDGQDLIDGGAGKDTLTGGADRDVFQFRDGDTGTSRSLADAITDFSQADGEKIHLGLVDADSNTAGVQAFSFIGTGAFTGTAGELRYNVAQGDTWVSADTNGDGEADWYIGLTGVHALTAADFVL